MKRSSVCMDATFTRTYMYMYGKQQLQQYCSCTNTTLFEREPLSSHKKHVLLKCTDGTCSSEESGPLGSSRPSVDCRYRNSAIFTWLFTSSHVAIFHHSNCWFGIKFHAFNFHGSTTHKNLSLAKISPSAVFKQTTMKLVKNFLVHNAK